MLPLLATERVPCVSNLLASRVACGHHPIWLLFPMLPFSRRQESFQHFLVYLEGL